MAEKKSIETKPFKQKIRAMFDNIAPTYDILNRVNTSGLDIKWRKDLVNSVALTDPSEILDIAAGTCDLSILLAKTCKMSHITATDISLGMLEIGKSKVSREQLTNISILPGDALQLEFDDNTFDVVTCAFGVRNFESIALGYKEMYRVLKPGGMVAILELCTPTNRFMRFGYDIHMKVNVPIISRLFGRKEGAYNYLRESVQRVPQREQMTLLMKSAGFNPTNYKVYKPGVCALYTGYKNDNY